MKFQTIKDLKKYLAESGHELSDLSIMPYAVPADSITTTTGSTIVVETSDSTSTAIEIEESSSLNVVVKSLSDQPNIEVIPLNESDGSDNVWYVDEFECHEGACSTSKVIYRGSTLLMNVCESEGVSHVTLVLEVDGEIKHIPFRLESGCTDCGDRDMIVSL